MHSKGGAVNRVELECQVLCAALRQSFVRQDKVGTFTTIREISHLFPDLLPPTEEKGSSNKINFYEAITVRPQAGANSILIGYLRAVRKFLRQENPRDNKQRFNNILNAGFVLRKPRLRLSHDMVISRRWIFDTGADGDEDEELADMDQERGSSQALESKDPISPVQTDKAAQTQAERPAMEEEKMTRGEEPKASKAPAEIQKPSLKENLLDPSGQTGERFTTSSPVGIGEVAQESGLTPTSVSKSSSPVPLAEAALASSSSRTDGSGSTAESEKDFIFDESQLRKPEVEVELPNIIRLMESAHLIGNLEVQALKAQIQLAPNIPAEQLIFNAGYATKTEISSLRLAQDLLSRGKISMSQFQVAMYDERMSGLRMAESLQVRGWLEVEVKNPLEDQGNK